MGFDIEAWRTFEFRCELNQNQIFAKKDWLIRHFIFDINCAMLSIYLLTKSFLSDRLGMLYRPYTIGFMHEFVHANRNSPFWIFWSTLNAVSLSNQYLDGWKYENMKKGLHSLIKFKILSLENNFLLQNFSHFRIFIIFDFNCIEIIIKLTKPTLHKMVSMKQWTQSQWWWSFGGFFV